MLTFLGSAVVVEWRAAGLVLWADGSRWSELLPMDTKRRLR